jgi:conjugative transfer pilus assembly protein TraH
MKSSKLMRVCSVAMAISIVLMPARAGFLDDFYTASGATANLTPGGVYQGQSSTVIAGGGLTTRVPNRTFNPITFSPPSFSSGCGGIDLYLGAFGFPSSAEMTAFMRNVGQAAGGIAFSIALKALSPELDSTINDFSQRIQKMVAEYKNACKAASALVEGVSGKSMTELKKEACEYGRSVRNDDTQCETNSADVAKTKQDAVQNANANPAAMLNPERNVVWRALNSVDYGDTLTQAEKEFIMSITGTVIFVIDNPNDNAAPRVIRKDPVKASIDEMINAIRGERGATNVSMEVYKCTHKATAAPDDNAQMAINNCLNAQPTTTNIGGGFLNKLMTSKDAVITAIRTRSSVVSNSSLVNHYSILHGASPLPLLKVIQASASNRNSMMSESLVDTYLEITATQMAIRYLRHALGAISQTNGFISTSNSQIDKDAMLVMMERHKELTSNLNARESTINQQITALSNSLRINESVQRYMQASLSVDMSRSLNLGR